MSLLSPLFFFCVVLVELATFFDNGAMIAQAGMLMYLSGQRQDIMDTRVNQRFRIDEVKVPVYIPYSYYPHVLIY